MAARVEMMMLPKSRPSSASLSLRARSKTLTMLLSASADKALRRAMAVNELEPLKAAISAQLERASPEALTAARRLRGSLNDKKQKAIQQQRREEKKAQDQQRREEKRAAEQKRVEKVRRKEVAARVTVAVDALMVARDRPSLSAAIDASKSAQQAMARIRQPQVSCTFYSCIDLLAPFSEFTRTKNSSMWW